MFPSATGMTQQGGAGGQNNDSNLMDHTTSYNGGGGPTTPPTPPQNMGDTQQQQQQSPRRVHHTSTSSDSRSIKNTAYVRIVEQPASKALRFRYECEGRSAGSIPGVNSTHENKTYPTIEVVGYKGRAFVVVSCVTKDKPYRPHPHNLVGKDGCKRGVCTIEMNSETMRAQFSNLGIQCVKKKDIEGALVEREKIKVDPFRTGFAHRFQPASIDLNAVRLCFQVFLEKEPGKFSNPLTPVVSNPIYDKKAMSDLIITRLCSCVSSAAGGKELILLCEKVAKEDISVRFFEEQNGQVSWEAFGDFQHTDVHKQTAIAFRTPRYKDIHIERPVSVNIQLRRPSDGACSEPLPFEYIPLDAADPESLKRKRQKINGDPRIRYEQFLERYPEAMSMVDQKPLNTEVGRGQQVVQPGPSQGSTNYFGVIPTPIKTEPRDPSPNSYSNFSQYRPPQETPSPQPQMSPIYQEAHSPYSVAGSVINNGANISPAHQYGGNISPFSQYTQGSTPEYNPYQQQQLSPFGNLPNQQQTTNTQQQAPSQQYMATNQQQQQTSISAAPGPYSSIAKQNNFNVENILTTKQHEQNHLNHNHHQHDQQHHQNIHPQKWKSNLMHMNMVHANSTSGGTFTPIIPQNDSNNYNGNTHSPTTTNGTQNHLVNGTVAPISSSVTNSQSIPIGDDGFSLGDGSLLDIMDSDKLMVMNSAELRDLQLDK